MTQPSPLAGPFRRPPREDGLAPTPETRELVQSQVNALLAATPSYHALDEADRGRLRERLVHIGAYAAECLRELCWQSEQLGQTPVVRKRQQFVAPVRAMKANADLQPSAANQIARITQQTLRAVAFPTFVADLIRGTFDAIVKTSTQQMESFMAMVENVSKTVDQFMADNISDFQARDWLKQRYPEHIDVKGGMAIVRDGADDKPLPAFQRDLNLKGPVSSLDDSVIEETLVPAARRRLAESRLQMLSTLVLMGVNRIVVTGGKIRATMGFHIDTTDRAREEQASDFDFRTAVAGSFGFGPWSASASMSISYVSSTRSSSDAEINTETDLTGEVELHFKSDYFPVQKFASGSTIDAIRGNTAVPEANALDTPNPLGSGVPAAGGNVERYTSPRSRRSPPAPSTMRPIGAPLPEVKRPFAPDAPPPKPAAENETKTEAPAPAPDVASAPADAAPPAEGKPDEKAKQKPDAKKKKAPVKAEALDDWSLTP
ncbi:MAG: hypothetical protein U1F41_01035 [Burkholderiales bacterium]